MAREYWVNINGSIVNIAEWVEKEQLTYMQMGYENGRNEMRDQVIKIGGDLARATDENRELRQKLGALTAVINDLIRAEDNGLSQIAADKLEELRAMLPTGKQGE